MVQIYQVPLQKRCSSATVGSGVDGGDGGVPGWGECRVKLGRSPPQLSTSSRLRSSDQIRTIIYNFAGDTGHQQEATSTIMEQTARARAGEHLTWWTLRHVKMATNDLLYTFRFLISTNDWLVKREMFGSTIAIFSRL